MSPEEREQAAAAPAGTPRTTAAWNKCEGMKSYTRSLVVRDLALKLEAELAEANQRREESVLMTSQLQQELALAKHNWQAAENELKITSEGYRAQLAEATRQREEAEKLVQEHKTETGCPLCRRLAVRLTATNEMIMKGANVDWGVVLDANREILAKVKSIK